MVELDEQTEQRYGFSEDAPSQGLQWLKYIVLGVAVIAPILILAFAPARRWGVSLLAYVNCLLYSVFAIYFIKKGTLGYLIPAIAPLWLIVGTCLGIIFFSFFYPDGTYPTMTVDVSYFVGGIRYQIVIFAFLLVYFTSMAWLLRTEAKVSGRPAMCSKHLAYLAFAIFVFVMSFHIVSRSIALPKFMMMWPPRLHGYYYSLLFVVGVLFTRISKTSKILLFVFLTVTALFYSLEAARAFVFLPVVALFSGIFFFSKVKNRTKIILAVAIIVGIPWFVVVLNTTRIILGATVLERGVGALQYKWGILKQWRYAAEKVPVGGVFFGRMFFTAGNLIVGYIPSQYPYRPFSPAVYAREAAVMTLPGPLTRALGQLRGEVIVRLLGARYSGTWLLRDYGLAVTETSSVETSIIGHFWMLGGYVPVLIGGFLFALVHAFGAWRVRRAWIKNPDKGLFYYGVLFHCIFWSFNWDLIIFWRTVVWHLIFAYFGFKLISPLLKIGYASAAEQYEELTLEGY